MTDFEFGIPRIRLPVSCKDVEIVIGIDEAGRGPVLGSLVYCAAFWPVSEHKEIEKLGFNDSKQVKESDRERMLQTILAHESIGWVVEELSAATLSEEMLKASPVSLNAISYDAVIKILSTIRDADPNTPIISDVFIDTVGEPETYKNRLIKGLGKNFGKFTIESKADATYKVVGAASIIAKVVRDKLLSTWKFPEEKYSTLPPFDRAFGSGYPGDETCVNWLEKSQERVFGYPNLIRFSWSTTQKILEKQNAVKVSWECDEEDKNGSAEITSFFGKSGEKRQKRTPYFTQRKMKFVIPSDLNSKLLY